MLALLAKEIKSFLSSLIGYIAMAVFLVLTGLFLWVFPGNFNILDLAYSDMEPLFTLAPWVFMFLIPAITMRTFSEEQRTGTIELLLTRPLTDLQIILAKTFAGVVLVLLALLPTLFYTFSVYQLGNPTGNLDMGGTWGSYIGLVFLASAFVSIGVFASSITPNQVVAFIVAVFLCFFVFIGFESISSFSMMGPLDGFVQQLGIMEHYQSMSRGVIDSRDVIYFLALFAVFIIFTKTVLQSRKW
jgi:ABC-2 type transport system permease protein